MRLLPRFAFPGVLFLFFLSGFSALLYQVIWQRMLGFFAGVDVYSVTITVAAFMGGLGCGSAVGGHLADRLSGGRRILVFCAAEAIIALFALLSKPLFYDLLYLRASGLGNSPFLLPIVLFLSLLLPTFCMGLTLPILAKSFTARIESASSVIGYLYGINTLGAAIGAFFTIWGLLRWYGFEEILRLGAALNAISAAGAVGVWWALRATHSPTMPVAASARDGRHGPEPARFPMSVWMLIYALSGFLALALEIVWFRFFGVLQKSTAFTFGNLLGVFLLGLALGVMAGVPLARRSRRPARAFLALQAAIPLYAAGTLAWLVRRAEHERFLRPLWAYLQGYETLNPADWISLLPGLRSGELAPEGAAFVQLFVSIYFLLPLLLIAPATFLMGLSFPLLQRAVQVSPALIGRRVGWLQALNIGGSLLGATLVGWVALDFLGTAGTMRGLVCLGGIFALLFAWHSASSAGGRAVLGGCALVLLVAMMRLLPSQEKLWATLHGAQPEAIILAESSSGLSLLKFSEKVGEQEILVFTNGLGQSWLPYGSIHTQIGMLGAMLHPKPEEVAVIGLGSGDTVFALAGSPHTTRLTCIEIVHPVYETLLTLAPRYPYPALAALLEDARIEWRFTDARTYLQRSESLFDIIEADALRPNSAYSGNLYSLEYFRMIRDHLKPGGLAVTWVPTERILRTFLQVFPHVILVNGVAVGSREAIETDPETIKARLADPFTTAHYRRIGTDVAPLLAPILTEQFFRYTPDLERGPPSDLNSDLFPRDEFGVPKG